MARNITRPLTDDETRTAIAVAKVLRPYVNTSQAVRMDYVKRDGSPRVLAGTVMEFIGHDSTSAVVIETDAGPRSANLYNVIVDSIRVIGKPEVR